MNPHFRELCDSSMSKSSAFVERGETMQKEAFFGVAVGGLLRGAAALAPRLFGGMASRFATRAAARAAAKAATSTVVDTAATGAAQVAKQPGLLSRIGHGFMMDPGDIAGWAAKRTGPRASQVLSGFQKGWQTPLIDAKGLRMISTPDNALIGYGAIGMASPMLGGPHLPGSEAAMMIGAPVLEAGSMAANAIGTGIKGVRAGTAANKAALASDIRLGAENTGYDLAEMAMSNPEMLSPGALNGAFSPPPAPTSGWQNFKSIIGRGEPGSDYVSDTALGAARQHMGLSKSSSLLGLGFGALSVGTPIVSSLVGKPYDEQKAQQLGSEAAVDQFSQATANMNPIARFMAQHFDPTLAIAGADKAHPGFAKGLSDRMASQGRQFKYGPLGSLYANTLGTGWAGDPKFTKPKYYYTGDDGQPQYIE